MATVRLQPIGNFKKVTVQFSSSSCHDHPQHITKPRLDQQGTVGGRGEVAKEGGRNTFLCIAHRALINTHLQDSTTAGGGFCFSYLLVPF